MHPLTEPAEQLERMMSADGRHPALSDTNEQFESMVLAESLEHFDAIMDNAPVLVIEDPMDDKKLPPKNLMTKVEDVARWSLVKTIYFLYPSVVQVSFLLQGWCSFE